MIRQFTRDVLHERHRLSHQQIDTLLNENTGKKYLSEKLKQLEKISYFLELAETLQNKDIWFLILKGPILSERIYGDPTTRLWKDFDLLIKPGAVSACVSILQEMGFKHDKVDWPASVKRQKMILHFGKNLEMYHSGKGLSVEIHWKLFEDRLAGSETEWQLIEQNSETTEFSGKTVQRLNFEFELLYLIIHGSRHSWFRLKWLVDIHDLLKRHSFDEQKFLRLTKKMRAERFVCMCNYVMGEYFPACKHLPCNSSNCNKLGEFAMKEIRKKDVKKKLSFAETVQAIRYRMALSPDFRYKLDVLRLVTFGKLDLTYSRIPDYPIFFYLFRPFGILIRKFQKTG